MYAFNENYILPLSHDEVVYGKGSLLRKMPGDEWQKFASLRLLYSYMWALPGKKLLFMGDEFGQWSEWNHDASLEWHLLDRPLHGQLARLVGTLNHLYRTEPALHLGRRQIGRLPVDRREQREGQRPDLSATGQGRARRHRRGVQFHAGAAPRLPDRRASTRALARGAEQRRAGASAAAGRETSGVVESRPIPWNGRRQSMSVSLPPLGAVFFKPPA